MGLEQKVKCDRCGKYGNGVFLRPAPHDLNDLKTLSEPYKLTLFGVIVAVNTEQVLAEPKFLGAISIRSHEQFFCSPACFSAAHLEAVTTAWQAALAQPGEVRVMGSDDVVEES